jgi:hypothetical protein
MKKKFECTWGTSYVNPGTKICDLELFSEGNGYDDDDREAVNALEIGQTITLDAGDHSVTRIS